MQASLPPLGLTQATLAAARAHQQLRSDSRGNILHPGGAIPSSGPHAGSTGGGGLHYSSSFGGLGPGSVYSSAAAGGGGGVSAPGSVAGLKTQPAGQLRRIFVTGGWRWVGLGGCVAQCADACGAGMWDTSAEGRCLSQL
jgi:hypothetical protein